MEHLQSLRKDKGLLRERERQLGEKELILLRQRRPPDTLQPASASGGC